ncbi:MAG: ATP synthase F1 subunit delta [Flavobacteriales bacterium]|nr:ATP synthase F1 subunit delta [Flavobacteriales bacterium]
MSGIRISSRYAKSLLDLCNNPQEQDTAFADMQLVKSSIDQSRDLEVFLSNPIVKKDKKVKILEMIFGSRVSKTTMSFITLLTTKGRESLMGEIATSFVHQFKTMRHITEANVVSAVALDAQTRAQIHAQAVKMAGGNIELVEKIDQDIIGGFVLNVADRQMDASLAEKITQLRREFSENPYLPEF